MTITGFKSILFTVTFYLFHLFFVPFFLCFQPSFELIQYFLRHFIFSMAYQLYFLFFGDSFRAVILKQAVFSSQVYMSMSRDTFFLHDSMEVLLVSTWYRSRIFASVKVLVAQFCPALCDLMDCSPLGSSVHGILQTRILERVAMQGIFLTQVPNLGLLHFKQILYHLSHQGIC